MFKCTYEIKENSTKGNFICEECESNEYKLNEFGMCEHCQLMENCVNCHYNDNYTKSICVKCSNNYYIIQMENVKNVNMNIMMMDIAIFAQKMELIMNHVLAGVGIPKLEIIIVLNVMIDVKNVIISKKQMILNVYHVI